MTDLAAQLEFLLADTAGAAAPPRVPWRLRWHGLRHTSRGLRLLTTRGWGPAHRYYRDLRPGPGWTLYAALEPRTAILLVHREVLVSQLALRAVAPTGLCLPRALSLGIYLSALGLPAEVVVGRERASSHPRYSFHAWTELYGEVLNDRPEVQLGHTTLQRVSAQALRQHHPHPPARP